MLHLNLPNTNELQLSLNVNRNVNRYICRFAGNLRKFVEIYELLKKLFTGCLQNSRV